MLPGWRPFGGENPAGYGEVPKALRTGAAEAPSFPPRATDRVTIPVYWIGIIHSLRQDVQNERNGLPSGPKKRIIVIARREPGATFGLSPSGPQHWLPRTRQGANMTINETTRSGILIFQTLGKLDATSAPEAERRIAELVNGGVRQIVMDLSGLDYISSAGLRFLLTSARRLQKAEGGLVVAAPSAQANQVIQMAGFSGLIPILDTVDAAIGSMKPLSQVSAGSPAQAQAASQATPTIGFAEEIYLLALDERKGIIKSVSVASLDYALAGALLMELAIRNRIDADLSIMKIISTASTGDPLLDNAMWLLALERRSTHEARPISFWLGVLAEESRQIQEHVLEQLVRKGILKQENRKILWVFEMKRYPITDDREVKEVRTRLRELILSDEVPEPRDVVLLNLGQSCRLLDDLFTAEEFERVYPRIEALMRLDLIGQEMTRTIRSIERSIAEAMSTSVMF